MALYHRATITPTKPEVVATVVAGRPWCDAAVEDVEVVGAFRFDDPLGRVGMETFLARTGGVHHLVPLTYRDQPHDDAAAAFITTVEHTVLGTRWVYDGLGDPTYLPMLAAVSLTGQGEALGMVEIDGRWVMAPTNVRIRGGGWPLERIPVDGLTGEDLDGTAPTFRNERFEMRVDRCPILGDSPTIGLTATWPGLDGAVVLTEVTAIG